MNYKESVDYSSLSTYMSCPRKFLFSYVMNLRPAGNSIHLVFGSCWHYGLESTYKLIQQDQQISEMDATINSIKAFNALWDLDGAPLWKNEDLIFPKSPGHAANMYKKYWERFLKIDTARKIIAVEAPFAIDLSSHHPDFPKYIGRIDLILGNGSDDGIEILDHKTAKAIYAVTSQQFEMSFQTDGYLTAGRIFYDKIPSITYRISLCQKTKIDFQPITINKRSAAIEHFLSNMIHFVSNILHDLNLLEEDIEYCHNRTDILKSFQRNPGQACTSFMTTCPYFDLCRLRNNPLDWMKKAPQGFVHQEWDPILHEENMKKRLKEVV